VPTAATAQPQPTRPVLRLPRSRPKTKPGTRQPSQETSGEQGSTATEKPESPGKPGSDQGAGNGTGERANIGPSQEDLDGRSDTAQPSDGVIDSKDAERREQPPDGQSVPHDGTMPSETEKQPGSAVATERPGNRDTGETPTDGPATPSAVDVGDQPESAPKPTEDTLVSVPDTQEPPRGSFEAPADIGDTRREPPRPAADSVEVVARPPEVEGQSESADRPQVDPRDQTLPAIDVNADAEREAHQVADGPREQDKARESGEDAGATSTERTATPGRRLERPDDEAELEIKAETDAKDLGIVSEQALLDRLTVHGVPLREALDPVGAAAWSNETGDRVADPTDRTGNWISDTDSTDIEKTKKERGDAFRKRFSREREGIADTAGKTTSKLQDLVSKRPPTGHLESRAGPDATPAPNQGIDAGDILTAGFAAGVMLVEGVRKIRRSTRQMRKA
jgi:hypothetical protein